MLHTAAAPPTRDELRKAMMARRDALSATEVVEKSTAIAELVRQLPCYETAATICSYLAIGHEVQTEPLIRALLAAGKRVVLPRTVFPDRVLTLHQIRGLDDLIPGRYGILEPAATTPEVASDDIDLFLVPGSTFDAAGNRLGYGAGFYDRLLAASRGWRVALAYACQLAPQVPAAPHDIPMDLLVMECGVIDCRRGQRHTDHLRLRNIQCMGAHGVLPEERAHGIRLAFDIDLRLDLQTPGRTDDLATAVNYPAVYQLVQRVQSAREYLLLEALAEHVADAILAEFPPVAEVTIAVRKFNPPVGGLLDAFEVELSRSRPPWLLPTRV